MKVLIATKNYGKIEGAKKALEKFYNDVEIEGISVESNVPEQPINKEIFLGAKNRVKNLKEYANKNNIKADLFLSIESGMQNLLGEYMITNIAVIEDNKGNSSCSTSPSFPVPDKYIEEIKATDLSKVMNKIFTPDDNRHNYGGGVQLLTHGTVSRIDLTEVAFIMALTKFINGDSWV
ncbi:MAG: DUF84 family protein [Clostridia bacterium]|nr:DUF84 family protein [Clostridia bacterium]